MLPLALGGFCSFYCYAAITFDSAQWDRTGIWRLVVFQQVFSWKRSERRRRKGEREENGVLVENEDDVVNALNMLRLCQRPHA